VRAHLRPAGTLRAGTIASAPARLGRHPADLVGVHAHDGRRRPAAAPPVRPCSLPTTSPRACASYYPVLYTGNKGLVAHECILDLRQITKESGVTGG
jgi:hypothetical protein